MLRHLFQRTGAIAMGSMVGHGLVLAATPILARAYPPAEFGALALLLTVSNIGMTVACLRYDVALPSAADEEVRGLLLTSLFAAVGLGAFAAAAVALLARQPWAARHLGDLLLHPVLMGTCLSLVGWYQATGAWLLRQGRYRDVGLLRLTQGGGFGALAMLPMPGLLWAHVVSFSGGLLGARGALRARSGLPWHRVAARYRDFPLLGLPGAVLDVVGYSLSIWVITASYGRGAAGEFSQLQRLIGAPLMLLSLSLGQVLLKQTAELAGHRPELRRLLGSTLRTLAGLAAIGVVGLSLVGAPLLRIILGPAWRIEREMVVLVGVAVFVRACVSPLSVVLLTLRRFRLALGWQAAYFTSAATLMPWVGGHLDLAGYVRFYALHELVFYSAYLMLIFSAVRED